MDCEMTPPIPRSPQEFRERAAECERLAEKFENPELRATMLDVAATWRRLAAQDEARMARLEPNGRTRATTPG